MLFCRLLDGLFDNLYTSNSIPFIIPEISQDEIILKLKKNISFIEIYKFEINTLLYELQYMVDKLDNEKNIFERERYISMIFDIKSKLVKIATTLQ